MREIKFRGKRLDNGQLVHGDLIHDVNHKKGKMYILPIQGGVIAMGYGIDPLDGYNVIPETVGQFTGLKDKNGNEIYDKDVLESNFGNRYLVEWHDDGWKTKSKDEHHGAPLYATSAKTLKKVGNIHQNPELI